MTDHADQPEPRFTLDLSLTDIEMIYSAMAQTGMMDPVRAPAFRALFKRLGDLLAERRGS